MISTITKDSTADQMVYLDQPGNEVPDAMVDLFCGAGGSGGGLLDATELLGRNVQGTFVNHWDKAIKIHNANHPEHRHLEEDLFMLDPTNVFPAETNCSLLWASPQCTFFSVARGASCVNEQDRSHAHSVTDWVKHLNPEAVLCENVKEFEGWGPTMQKRRTVSPRKGELIWAKSAKPVNDLPRGWNRARGESETDWSIRMIADGYQRYEVPDPNGKGEYFKEWIADMERLGYDADWRTLRSADYGDPTIRQRLFVYFVRKDSPKKIVWPEPYAEQPKPGVEMTRPMPWITTRQIIDWSLKGDSVFTRKRKLADNTFRRLAIGLVKFGLKDFLSPKSDAYVIPKDRGHDKRYVKSVDHPMSAVTTRHTGEGLVEPNIIHLKGKSTAQDIDVPLSALTAKDSHFLSQPSLDAVAAPRAGNQALAEAFMFTLDQTGGSKKPNHGCYSVDEPLRTLVTKANASCIEFELEALEDAFLHNCEVGGVDLERAKTFLGYLVEELHSKGKVDAKPWVYVYYSNGAEGKEIDAPLPAVRTKAGHALVYPVIELEGKYIKIDLFYRMLTPLELQRAMGFPDDMDWAGCNKADQVRAIGNSVSRGVSRALGLAWYSQDSNVWQHVKPLYENYIKTE